MDEARNVGEVRRKVEKMTYEEEGEAGGQELDLPDRDDDEQPDSAMSLSTAGRAAKEEEAVNEGGIADDGADEDEDEDERGEEWEEIEKDEAAGALAEEDQTKGDGLKRKALDRNESSFAHDDEEGVKRQKDTPPVRVASRPRTLVDA